MSASRPPRDRRAYLWDILDAANSLVSLTADKTISDYLTERPLRSAVEREFEIIGEALNQLEKQLPDVRTKITDFAKIVGFRNRLIHGYFAIDHEIVWGAVELFLPTLVEEVKRLLEADVGDD
jgi:uncharacterized protein with HEPN domain